MFPDVSLVSAALLLLGAYLIGSIPSTLIAGRMSAKVDLRDLGSGNAGGTNAIRVLGPVRGLIAGLADAAKGFVCTAFLASLWFDAVSDITVWQVAAGSAAIVGHIWPVWAGFRGGKGVATTIGLLVAIDPLTALIYAIIGLTGAAATRYVSVGSLLTSILLPVQVGFQAIVLVRPVSAALMIFGLALPLLIVYTHRENLGRLQSGTELRLGNRVAP